MLKVRVRRLLSVTLAFLFILALPANAFAIGLDDSNSWEFYEDIVYVPFDDLCEELLRKMALQERAAEAWNVLWEAFFKPCDSGFMIYPDDFAGGWIDGENLHIALTSESSEWEKYKELLYNFLCIIVFETAEHSLNQLNEIRALVSDELFIRGYPILAHAVDEINNTIVLRLSELNISLERSVYTSISDIIEENQNELSLFADNRSRDVNRRTVLGRNVTDDLFDFVKSEEVVLKSGLMGGMGIGVIREFGNEFTLGATGSVRTDRTMNGFITSGHGLRVGDPIYRNSVRVGVIRSLNFAGSGNVTTPRSDWAFVEVTNNSFSLTRSVLGSANATFQVNSVTAEAPVGRVLIRHGMSSGHGLVVVTHRREQRIGNQIWSIAARVLNQTMPILGDSGGPFFSTNGNNADFAGILSGGFPSNGNFYVTIIPPRDFGLVQIRTTNW